MSSPPATAFSPQNSAFSHPSNIATFISVKPTMKLNHLVLRPSTLAILKRRGFNTTLDVIRSADYNYNECNGSLHNFSIELNVTLVQAARIRSEVRHALSYSLGEKASMDKSKDCNVCTHQHSNNPYICNLKKKKITLSDNKSVQTQISSSQTAANILYFYNHLQAIKLLVHSIDTLLGSGFALEEITELVGQPGSGKSQLGMQLCVNATIPKTCGGTEGSAIYIDSEGSFIPERIFKMAKGIKSYLSSLNYELPAWYTCDHILDNIYRYRVYDETCLIATLISLPNFIKKLQKKKKLPKLIVVDSIAFPYRCSRSDYKTKTKNLINIATVLSNIASKFHLAVVVTNHMTMKGDIIDARNQNFENYTNSRIMPALGEYWAHTVTTRLILSDDIEKVPKYYHCNKKNPLSNEGDFKICELVKSPYQPPGKVGFRITNDGLRNCS